MSKARNNIARLGLALLSISLLPCMSAEKSANPEAEKHLVLLANDKAVLGVMPHVGGRVVLYRAAHGTNMLLADEKQWAEPPEKAPQPTPTADFIAYNGHIVWVGPESQWWKQQSLNDDRRKSESSWPPDPYIEYGRFEIVEQTPLSLKMAGPESPISGLKLTKEIRLESNGKVVLRTEAVNIRQTPVSWDLWSNTRLPSSAVCYVPVREEAEGGPTQKEPAGARKSVRVKGNLPWDVREGFFHFLPNTPVPAGKRKINAKAFLDPAKGLMAAFHSGFCFLKRTHLTPREKIHSEEAPVEVFLGISHSLPDEDLLELEFHGEYRTLRPGEKMAIEETWEILPYDGLATPEDHVRFLTSDRVSAKRDAGAEQEDR